MFSVVVCISHCAGHCERNKGTRISKSCSVWWYVCHTVLDIVNAIRGRGLVSLVLYKLNPLQTVHYSDEFVLLFRTHHHQK